MHVTPNVTLRVWFHFWRAVGCAPGPIRRRHATINGLTRSLSADRPIGIATEPYRGRTLQQGHPGGMLHWLRCTNCTRVPRGH